MPAEEVCLHTFNLEDASSSRGSISASLAWLHANLAAISAAAARSLISFNATSRSACIDSSKALAPMTPYVDRTQTQLDIFAEWRAVRIASSQHIGRWTSELHSAHRVPSSFEETYLTSKHIRSHGTEARGVISNFLCFCSTIGRRGAPLDSPGQKLWLLLLEHLSCCLLGSPIPKAKISRISGSLPRALETLAAIARALCTLASLAENLLVFV